MTFDTTPVPVPVGDCRCPGTPHGDGDVVFLAPMLSTPGGMAARAAIVHGFTDEIAAQEQLAGIWLRHGIVDWSFTDEDGDPIPVSPDAVASLLPYGKGGREVAEKADDLYAQDVLDPIQRVIAAATKDLERQRRSKRGPTPKPDTSTAEPSSSTPPSTKRPRSRS